jgi:hypothetical protein
MSGNQQLTDLGAAVRAAILRDMEATEAYHRRRMEECRAAGEWGKADEQQRLAEMVRVCIVVAQSAATRVIETGVAA